MPDSMPDEYIEFDLNSPPSSWPIEVRQLSKQIPQHLARVIEIEVKLGHKETSLRLYRKAIALLIKQHNLE